MCDGLPILHLLIGDVINPFRLRPSLPTAGFDIVVEIGPSGLKIDSRELKDPVIES